MSYKKYFMWVNVSAQNKKASQKSEIAPAPKWLVKFSPVLAKWTKWNTPSGKKKLKEKESFKALIVISVPYCGSNSGNAFHILWANSRSYIGNSRVDLWSVFCHLAVNPFSQFLNMSNMTSTTQFKQNVMHIF